MHTPEIFYFFNIEINKEVKTLYIIKEIIFYMVFFKKEENGFRCLACAHNCIIRENKTGICGVRGVINNKAESLVYGKPAAVAIDPIEKKPLYHFFPGTRAFSIGTFGCNFRCMFCQNHELSQSVKLMSAKEVKSFVETHSHKLLPEDVVESAKYENCKSIAYTYNEPIVFIEYVLDTAKIAKKQGIKNLLVTNGFYSEYSRKVVINYIDAANVDLKSMKESFYRKLLGAHLDPVLETIKYLHKKGVWIEITTLLIPGENDSKEELREIASFIKSISKSIPWHISRFFPHYKMLDKLPTEKEKLIEARNIGLEEGLEFVYIGNLPGEWENTYCPNCKSLLIERFMYHIEIKDLDLETSRCKSCGYKIKGIFN